MTEQSTIVGTAASRAESSIKGFARGRQISLDTLRLLGVGFGTVFFPDLKKQELAIKFHYREGWKARALEHKSFVAGDGFKACFWNLDRVLESRPASIYITEGELDACALVQAGIPADQVLSVPCGANEQPAKDIRRSYGYVFEALEAGLKNAERIVWCGDNDAPGHTLRSDMVQIFGSAKFYFVDWPAKAKDAGDVLRFYGSAPLFEVINNYLPWPVDGLFVMDKIPDPPAMVQWHPGFSEWKEKVFLAPRTLSVVTGHPGHGKTMLWQQIWYQVIKQYDLVACMASFETRAKPHIRRQIRTLHSGLLEREMGAQEIAAADVWINDHYLFMIHADERPTLDWFLDLAEVAVIRHGAKIIQIDPWNRFEHDRGRDEMETEYIGRALKRLHVFAHDFNCHVQILAHPAKMDSRQRGNRPSLEDISGSKHWHNMADQGFVVHREKMFEDGQRRTEASLFYMKSRFEELGYPCELPLDYVLAQGKFVSTVFPTKD